MPRSEPHLPRRRRARLRGLLTAVALALAAAPAAVGEVRALTSERSLDYDLKLIAVAPGASWYDVVGTVTGDSSRHHRARIPRDGFAVPVARVAVNRWRALW